MEVEYMPNILLTRIDNRLVHGQVGVTWTKTLGANLIVVADDTAAEDRIQQSLMSVTAKSSGVGIRFFTIEKTAAIIGRAAPEQKIFIVCRTPKDVRRLVEGRCCSEGGKCGKHAFLRRETRYDEEGLCR